MHPDSLERFVRATGADHVPVQEEMVAYADEHGFPIIGPDAGAVLRLLARLTDAERVFEFGSGYGYSASWFFRGGADHVVLTEYDEDELAMAESFLDRLGYADRATFEHGDAIETVDRYDGPFDVVLVDHDKERYALGFEKVREKVRPGGVVVADNMVRGPIDFDALVAYFDQEQSLPEGANEATHGVVDYLETVRADPAFESFVLPVGSGICLSTRVADADGV
jgi:predicted O-methyltransferase YrrM